MVKGYWKQLNAALEMARVAYSAEVERLVDELAPRIRAGEFSGCGDEGPRYSQLEAEFAEHPWSTEAQSCHLVMACSSWQARMEAAAIDPVSGAEISLGEPLAAECLAHDVLHEAARRGWVEPMWFLNDRDAYQLRRAA